jgi:hypothetical protein
MPKKTPKGIPPGLSWRVGVTIFGGIGLLIFLLLFLVFYPTNFTTFQNIAVVLVAILVLGAATAALWIPWGMQWGPQAEEWGMEMEAWGKKMEKKHGPKPRRKRRRKR